MIQFQFCQFTDLNSEQLYAVLALRSAVFVVEQTCHYLDPDGRDSEAIHLLGMESNKIVAYLRLFPPLGSQDYIEFGRVLTASHVRSKGYGKKLMQAFLNYCEKNHPKLNLKCSAQVYLQKFYESFGFKAYGDAYDDVGVLHIDMEKTIPRTL